MIRSRTAPRVLVIRAGQLGDTVFATSTIEPLRHYFGAEVGIDFVLKRGMEGLFRHDRRVARTFTLRHRNLWLPFNLDKLGIVKASRKQPYDWVVNLEVGALLNDLARAVRARRKVGRPHGAIPTGRDGEHAVSYLRRVYGTFLPTDCLEMAEPSLRGAPWPDVAERRRLPERFVALNPTNSHFTKRDHRAYRAWPVEHWRELIATLAGELAETVVLVGGKGERAYFRLLEPFPPGVIDLAGRTSLDELITILARARALITTDTGPSHVAAAVGTPVLAVFGPSDPRVTAPFATPRNTVHVLAAGLPCSPCSFTERIKSCPWNRCMHEVTPQRVLELLSAAIG